MALARVLTAAGGPMFDVKLLPLEKALAYCMLTGAVGRPEGERTRLSFMTQKETRLKPTIAADLSVQRLIVQVFNNFIAYSHRLISRA